MEIYEVTLLHPVDVRLTYKNNYAESELQDMLVLSQDVPGQVRRLAPGYHTFMPENSTDPTIILVEEDGKTNVWELRRNKWAAAFHPTVRRKMSNLYESPPPRTIRNPNHHLSLGLTYIEHVADSIAGSVSLGQVRRVERVLVSRR